MPRANTKKQLYLYAALEAYMITGATDIDILELRDKNNKPFFNNLASVRSAKKRVEDEWRRDTKNIDMDIECAKTIKGHDATLRRLSHYLQQNMGYSQRIKIDGLIFKVTRSRYDILNDAKRHASEGRDGSAQDESASRQDPKEDQD